MPSLSKQDEKQLNAILSEIKTAIKDNKTWDLYQEYEDDNYHTECVLLYAHTVGSAKDKENMIEVWKERQLSDSLEDSIAVRRDDISKKLWFKFVSNATEKEGIKIMEQGGGVYPVIDERKQNIKTGVVLLTKDTEKEAKEYVFNEPDLFYEKLNDEWAVKKYNTGGGTENSFGTREDFDALYEMFPDNHEGTVAKWNSLSQEQKDAFINDLYVTDAASEHIAESWLEFVNALSEEDWLENCTNWDEYSEEEEDSEDEAYKRGATVKGQKHVSVTKGYRMPHGYEAVKGSDKKHTYSKGHPKVRVDEGYRMPKGYEVVEGAYNEKYAKGGGFDDMNIGVGDSVLISDKAEQVWARNRKGVVLDMQRVRTSTHSYTFYYRVLVDYTEEFGEPHKLEYKIPMEQLTKTNEKYAKGATIEEEEVYISFLNKDKGFKEDEKYFKGKDAYQKAVEWGRANFERFNSDMISYTKYAKGSTIRANKSEPLKYANFEDNWHINLLKLNPYKNQDGLKYKGENKYAVGRVGAESGQEVFEFKTLEQAEVKFGELVTKSKTYSPLISEGKTNNYAKGSTIEGGSCLKEEVYPTDSIVSNWDEKECKSFLFAHWGMRGVDGKGITALETNRNIDNLRLEVLSQIEYAKKHNVPCEYGEGATIQGEGKNIYKAFYKGKEIDLKADSSYSAQTKAAVIFKAKKSYEVTVVVLSVEGKDITHSTSSFAKGGGVDSIEEEDENIAKSVYNDYYKTWQVYIDGSLYGEFKTEEESQEYIHNGGYKQESCGCGCEVKSSESDWTSTLDEEEKALACSVFNKVVKSGAYIEPSNLKNGNKQSLIKALSGSLEMFSDTGKKVATSMLDKLK